MKRIVISAAFASIEEADRIFDALHPYGFDRLGIVDGTKVVVEALPGEAARAVAAFEAALQK